MPITHSVIVHDRGPALWPEHKPLSEITDLQENTPDYVWSATYQGNPTPPGGYLFRRDAIDRWSPSTNITRKSVARWMSIDTATKAQEQHDYTALTVADLLPDYRLIVRHISQHRMEFADLTGWIISQAIHWNRDDKLREIIIEDKGSGTDALSTLSRTAPEWIRQRLTPFMPIKDKVTRANKSSVWFKNGSVLLPHPHMTVSWLKDFEDQFFDFPVTKYDDMVDTITQLILFLEDILATGYKARMGELEHGH